MLFYAQQFARAADFHIAQGQAEAAPEVAKFHERGQTLFGFFGRVFFLFGFPVDGGQVGKVVFGLFGFFKQPVRVEQIAERLLVAAADTSAQLVELREPEIVGVFHNQRIGVGDVDTGFDDGGGQ